ncbi:hypothetical protein [Streptomyces sp. t99]|uniref:hypothetical protein n=1 Tax=Streptomyces sp. t99 TaxID=1828172 RepID=UPI0015CF54C4|nr:hypothetical protein [Streptomyces sp. t99]
MVLQRGAHPGSALGVPGGPQDRLGLAQLDRPAGDPGRRPLQLDLGDLGDPRGTAQRQIGDQGDRAQQQRHPPVDRERHDDDRRGQQGRGDHGPADRHGQVRGAADVRGHRPREPGLVLGGEPAQRQRAHMPDGPTMAVTRPGGQTALMFSTALVTPS